MGHIYNLTFNCSLYADSVFSACWIEVCTFIISVLFVLWPLGVEAICAFRLSIVTADIAGLRRF